MRGSGRTEDNRNNDKMKTGGGEEHQRRRDARVTKRAKERKSKVNNLEHDVTHTEGQESSPVARSGSGGGGWFWG